MTHQPKNRRRNKMLKRDEKGFTLIELLIVIAIIGILAAIAIPQFNQYKQRAYLTTTKNDLHNLYLACKAFWIDNGGATACPVPGANGAGTLQNSFGFNQSADVTIAITTATETAFVATGTNANVPGTTNTINASGNIS